MREHPSVDWGLGARLAVATAAAAFGVILVSIAPAPSGAQANETAIIVEKQTEPDGAVGSFTFTFTGAPAGTISDNGQIMVPVVPGTYISTEVPVTGFDLASISCDDSDSTGNIAARTAIFNVDPGETVTCTFTNRQQVQVVAPLGTPAALELDVARELVVRDRAKVRATGTTPAPLMLSMFVDPLGRPCPPSATARPAKARVLVSERLVGGSFSVGARYRPTRHGGQTFCGYLGPSEDAPTVSASASETVKPPPLLRAAAARHAVRLALRRHGFTHRVIDELEQRCRRHGRAAFRCRFEAKFRGYELDGRGKVRRTAHGLTYRFHVRAQGVRFVLTHRNEGRTSG
jgi:hypothetical protein